MRTKLAWTLGLLVLWIAGTSCAAKPRVFVVYNDPGALGTDDRVYWENLVIGSVGDLEKNPGGRTVVPLRIKEDFRPAVTDRSRFVVEPDPNSPGRQSVKMLQLGSGGAPLPEGAVVQGSTSYSLLKEKGRSDMQGLPRVLQDAFDRLDQEIGRLSDKEWLNDLQRQIDVWIAIVQASSQEVRRVLKEVLPKIQQVIEDAVRRLRELGNEKEARALQQKLEELKRALNSPR